MFRFIVSLGPQPESPDEAPMTPPPGYVNPTPEPRSAGGLASVFKGLTGSRMVRSPPPQPSPTSPTAVHHQSVIAEGNDASLQNPNCLSPTHMEFFESLSSGAPNDRIAAANSLRYAIADYTPGCVLDVWEAGKDLIEPSKPGAARAAGWELLTECVKHPDSTDLERKEYFEMLSKAAHPDDFHLQLAALVDLTASGRDLSGFDYDVIPLLTSWLAEVFETVKLARKLTSKGSKKGKSVPVSGEDKNLAQLFAFIGDVIRFSFNVANEAAVSGLVDGVLDICMVTSHEEDLTACIGVIDFIVTFGAIPNGKLKRCVQVLSTIYCLVSGLETIAWHTLSILCKSHNGQETVEILLEVLRSLPREGSKGSRDARGALRVLQELLSRTTEKGYPPVPFPLLMEGLTAVVKASGSMAVRGAVLSVINSLFDDGSQRPHQMLVDEDWTKLLDVAAACVAVLPDTAEVYDSTRLTPAPTGDAKQQELVRKLNDELALTISHIEYFLQSDSSDFTQRHSCVSFLTANHRFLPDSAARIILDYFKEFRCCMPSDTQWESNLDLVTTSFLKNQRYSTETRLRSMTIVRDSYDMVEIVADQLEDGATTKFVKSILEDISDETDVAVLREVLDLVVMMAVGAPMSLFEFIVDNLRTIINNDRLRSPISAPTSMMLGPSSSTTRSPATAIQTLSDIVATAYVRIFTQTMHSNSAKSVRIFNLLVNIAKSRACETDARLTAMKLLFRLRADWGNRIFLVSCTNSEGMATYLYRTEASFARRQMEEQAQRSRPTARPSRGTSFGAQGQANDRNTPARSTSGAKPALQYRQLWMLPDPNALPDGVSLKSSPILVSHVEDTAKFQAKKQTVLNMASWLEALLYLFQQGFDWEVYSFVLVHLPSQLSNHAVFRGAIAQIQNLRKIVCGQIKNSSFQEPPDVIGLRRSDVALCLFQLLTTLISYHNHFTKKQYEDEIVGAFLHGLNIWDRSYRCCIHALYVCAHGLPMSTSKALVSILSRMSQIISQPAVSIHILEFLACLSRMPSLYSHFREEEYRIVFGICFRYLQDVRDKKQSQKFSASVPVTPASSIMPTNGGFEASLNPSVPEDLPQYVYALAYHVITFWFLQIRLPDRALYVNMITKQLFSDVDGTHTIEEQAETTIDFMQRVAFADNNESVDDPLFTPDRFGPINTKNWLVGQSIVTIRQAASSGWSQITKRQPSGTSSFTIRESLRPPPPHQIESQPYTNRDGKPSTNVDILPSHLMVHLFNIAPQTESILRPIPLPDDDHVERSIRLFDMNSTVDGHKVGVIYIGDGQSKECEILSNVSGSREYVAFLNGLGTLTRLKGAKFNTQGLDREYDSDGKYTFCWRDKVTEMVFHVTTQMPTNLKDDAQCIYKKRHIGNDYVNIIFNDSGLPFRFDTFPGDFNFVKIVITPESRASFTASREKSTEEMRQSFYQVLVMSKPGFPEISPASETKMVSLAALPEFVRLLALNASVFSYVWANRDGGEHISPWRGRLREIKLLRDRYGPKTCPVSGGMTPIAPSPPGTSLGVVTDMGGGGGGRPPVPNIRDSFGSFRRSSIATFFTSTSEQTSHRSSVLSTANTAETELIPTSGADSIVDTLDFSRWA